MDIIVSGMIGGTYDSFMTYEPFPFDTEYLNTKIPNLILDTEGLAENTIDGDSPTGEQKIEEGGEVSEPNLTESGVVDINSSEEMTSSGPILPPTPPNAV